MSRARTPRRIRGLRARGARCLGGGLLIWWAVSASFPDPAQAASGEEEAAEAAGSVACARALAERVQARYDAIDSFEARFEQTIRSVTLGGGALASDEASSGRVVFAKPGRMRWSYETPSPSLMVSDGNSIWIHDPVAREASRLPVEQGLPGGAALRFLMGQGRILESFRVQAEACPEGSGPGEPVALELVPMEPASYERLVLRVDPASAEIRETEVADVFGNVTRVRFLELRFDVDPDAGTFRFEAPEGTRIVDLLAPP